MYGRRICIYIICLTLMLALSAPCHAWLFDTGGPSGSGPSVKEGTNTVWVSQSFTLSHDCVVTSFGAAVARAFGTPQMGFNLYLTDTAPTSSTPVIASGLIRPAGPGYVYNYVNLTVPVRLNAGQKYYLTLSPNSNNFSGSICYAYVAGVEPGLKSGNYGETWNRDYLPFCVRVDGYAVPEVDSRLTVLMGAVLIAGAIVLKSRYGSQAAAGRV
jgi:hypothetical protein